MSTLRPIEEVADERSVPLGDLLDRAQEGTLDVFCLVARLRGALWSIVKAPGRAKVVNFGNRAWSPRGVAFCEILALKAPGDTRGLRSGSARVIVTRARAVLPEPGGMSHDGPTEEEKETLEAYGEFTVGLADLYVDRVDVEDPPTRRDSAPGRARKPLGPTDDWLFDEVQRLLRTNPRWYHANGTPNRSVLANTIQAPRLTKNGHAEPGWSKRTLCRRIRRIWAERTGGP